MKENEKRVNIGHDWFTIYEKMSDNCAGQTITLIVVNWDTPLVSRQPTYLN